MTENPKTVAETLRPLGGMSNDQEAKVGWPRQRIHTYGNPTGKDEVDIDVEHPTLSATNVIDKASSVFVANWRLLDDNRRVLALGKTADQTHWFSEDEMMDHWRERTTRNPAFDGLCVDEFYDPAVFQPGSTPSPPLLVAQWIRCIERFVHEFPDKVFVPWITIGGEGGTPPPPISEYMVVFFDMLRAQCPYVIVEFYRTLPNFPDFDDHGAGAQRFQDSLTLMMNEWEAKCRRLMKKLVIGLTLASSEPDAPADHSTRRREVKFIRAQIQNAWAERRLWAQESPAGIALFRPLFRYRSELAVIHRELKRYLDNYEGSTAQDEDEDDLRSGCGT